MRLFQGAYDSTVADDWPCGRYAEDKGEFCWCLGVSCLVCFALTLLCSFHSFVNYFSILQVNNFGFDADFPQAMVVQLRWSKKIREETSAPQQLVFASLDERICAILHLAAHLEGDFQPGIMSSTSFIFD